MIQKSHLFIIGCVLFIGDLTHLALDKTDIDAFVDSRMKHSRDWILTKMTAPVTTDDGLTKIATALKSATLESPIIAVVYISGTNTTSQLLGKMVKTVRECITPKPAQMMTMPCYTGQTWDDIAESERNTCIALLGELVKLTTKEQITHCFLNEPYLDERYATADNKYHVRTMMDKILKVIPLPKKVKKNDFAEGLLNFGNNKAGETTRAHEPTQTIDGFIIKDI